MSSILNILIIVDPGIPVPPSGYGGIERVAALLAIEYNRRGHKVTILASKGSEIYGCKVYNNGSPGFPMSPLRRFTALVKTCIFLALNFRKFDLIQNFGRLAYFFPILNSNVKKVMCYQREISLTNIHYFIKFPQKNAYLVGCSKNLIANKNLKGKWHVVHNPINFSYYNSGIFNDLSMPLIFLSRICFEKGCHIAIKVAKATNNKLIIAGNLSSGVDDRKYFQEFVEPHIDGQQIVYVGEVNDSQKKHYLSNSKAMLFPILWEEPFGIVMIESMACGTPVIAFNRGSVDEVIDQGITGFKVNNEHEMIVAILNIQQVDRLICRQHAQQRFDVEVIASQYLSLI